MLQYHPFMSWHAGTWTCTSLHQTDGTCSYTIVIVYIRSYATARSWHGRYVHSHHRWPLSFSSMTQRNAYTGDRFFVARCLGTHWALFILALCRGDGKAYLPTLVIKYIMTSRSSVGHNPSSARMEHTYKVCHRDVCDDSVMKRIYDSHIMLYRYK